VVIYLAGAGAALGAARGLLERPRLGIFVNYLLQLTQTVTQKIKN